MTEPIIATVEDAIEAVATGMVASGQEDGRSFTHVPVRDLIEADRYLSGKRAASKAHFGLRITKCIPPGGG